MSTVETNGKTEILCRETEDIKKNQMESSALKIAITKNLKFIGWDPQGNGDSRKELVSLRIKSTGVHQSGQHRENWSEKKKNAQSLRDLWDNHKRYDIRIISVPDGEEKECGTEKIFEELRAESFQSLPEVIKFIDLEAVEAANIWRISVWITYIVYTNKS